MQELSAATMMISSKYNANIFLVSTNKKLYQQQINSPHDGNQNTGINEEIL